MLKKLHRLGVKVVGGAKRFGNKHKGKIALVGAVAGGVAHANAEFNRDGPNKRARARTRAEELMNAIADEDQADAVSRHNELMSGARQQPQGGGNLAEVEAEAPGVIGMVRNIPKVANKLEAGAKSVEDASVLKKGKAVQSAVVDITGAINEPTKKAKKKADKFNEQNRRFLAGEMSDKEAKKFIKKKARRERKK